MKLLEEIIIPKDTVNDDEVRILDIYVKNGDLCQKDSSIIDIETSKANVELFNKTEGYIEILVNMDDIIKIGEVVARVWDSKIEKIKKNERQTPKDTKAEQIISKKAKELIQKSKIDIKLFNNLSHVKEKDVKKMIESKINNDNFIEQVKINLHKRAEINNLMVANNSNLTSYVVKKINTKKIELSKHYKNPIFEGSIAPLLIYFLGKILVDEYSLLNSYTDGKFLFKYTKINVGLAINLGAGLKVGVIKNVNNKSIEQIEKNIILLIDKYIDNKLDNDSLSGATITITDLTEENILFFRPLLNDKNCVMIGISGEKNAEQYLNIAFDHRVTDGQFISRFINNLINKMEKK